MNSHDLNANLHFCLRQLFKRQCLLKLFLQAYWFLLAVSLGLPTLLQPPAHLEHWMKKECSSLRTSGARLYRNEAFTTVCRTQLAPALYHAPLTPHPLAFPHACRTQHFCLSCPAGAPEGRCLTRCWSRLRSGRVAGWPRLSRSCWPS